MTSIRISREEAERRRSEAKKILILHVDCYCHSYWTAKQTYDDMGFLLGLDKD